MKIFSALALLLTLVALFAPVARCDGYDDDFGDFDGEGDSSRGSFQDEYFGRENDGSGGNGGDGGDAMDSYGEWFHNDYYGCLGVSPSSTPAEIKRAYRLLSLEHHPDKSKAEGAQQRFTEIGKAYAVLRDKEARAAYDEFMSTIPPQFRPRYGHVSIPVWQILLAFSLIVSVFQYTFQFRHARNIREFAMEQPRYRHALEAARARGEIGADELLPVDVLGAAYPEVHHLLFFQLGLFPYYIARYIYDSLRWRIMYDVLGKEHTEADKETMELYKTGLSLEEYRKLKAQEEKLGRKVQTLAVPEWEDDYDFEE